MADGNGATATLDPGPPSADQYPAAGGPQVYRLGDLLDEWDSHAQTVYDARRGNLPPGIRTGLDAVDDSMGGAFAPGLHSIQGKPGSGKTALVLQVAATCGFPALYVTCEMSPLELLRRITARVTGTYLNRFKTGELDPEESKAQVRRAIATCPELVIVDCTREYVPAFATSGNSLYDLAQQVRGDSRHTLIVVDSLHSWTCKAPTAGTTEYESLNGAITSLGGLAAVLSCPVLAVAERNRANIQTGGMSAGAGTRKIEYSAESVIELDTDKDAPLDANLERGVTLELSKNRNGEYGKPIALKFNGALMRFREV